jgi:hypothetical protein
MSKVYINFIPRKHRFFAKWIQQYKKNYDLHGKIKKKSKTVNNNNFNFVFSMLLQVTETYVGKNENYF